MDVKKVFALLSEEQREFLQDFDKRFRASYVHLDLVHELADKLLCKGRFVKALGLISSIRSEVLSEFVVLARDLRLDKGMRAVFNEHRDEHAAEPLIEFHELGNLTAKQQDEIVDAAAQIRDITKKIDIIMEGQKSSLQEELKSLASLERELHREEPRSLFVTLYYGIIKDCATKLSSWLLTEKEQCIDRINALLKSYPTMENKLQQLGEKRITDAGFQELLAYATLADIHVLEDFVRQNKQRLPADAWERVFQRKKQISKISAVLDKARQAWPKLVKWAAAKAVALEKLAYIDGLTNAWNRRYYDETMKKSFEGHRKFSLAMIDIDFFKRLNDSFGHPVGDIVLQFVVDTLKRNVRENDMVCRYGGEEFAIIINAEKWTALKICERIRERVEKESERRAGLKQDNVDFLPCKVTVSIGVAQYPEDGDAVSLRFAADAALYHAKLMGRNRVIVARKDITDDYVARFKK